MDWLGVGHDFWFHRADERSGGRVTSPSASRRFRLMVTTQLEYNDLEFGIE